MARAAVTVSFQLKDREDVPHAGRGEAVGVRVFHVPSWSVVRGPGFGPGEEGAGKGVWLPEASAKASVQRKPPETEVAFLNVWVPGEQVLGKPQ